jgi:hypothetical protein
MEVIEDTLASYEDAAHLDKPAATEEELGGPDPDVGRASIPTCLRPVRDRKLRNNRGLSIFLDNSLPLWYNYI